MGNVTSRVIPPPQVNQSPGVGLDMSRGIPFGRYRLLERLGAGGMAVVYKAAVDGPKNFSHTLVIKRIIPHLAHEPRFIAMLAAEARLAGLLLHPNIVPVHEFGEVGGEHYLAMELVDGFDLNAVLRRCQETGRRLPPGLVCYIISELAQALQYAHTLTDATDRPLEIVHRDISPSNIMLTRHGVVKLLDFGIAKAAGHARDEITNTATVKGKFSYMSPEQIQGQPVDSRADLFALGVVFHECLTMRRLFRSDCDAQTIHNVCSLPITPPSQLTTGVDAELDAVVLRMLSRTLSERFHSGEEIVDALAPFSARLGGDTVGLRRFLRELRPPEQVGRPVEASDTSSRSRMTSNGGDGSKLSIGEMQSRTEVMRPTWSWRRQAIGAAVVATLSALVAAPLVHRRAALTAPAALGSIPAAAIAPGVAVAPEAALAAAGQPLPAALSPPAAARGHEAVDVAASMTRGNATSAARAQPAAATAPAPPAAVAATIRLRVNGTLGAEVLLDNEVIGEVPLDVVLPRQRRVRTLSVRKAGYARYAIELEGNADTTLTTMLSRLGRGHAKHEDNPLTVIRDPFAE
jgi:serine/threonine-protein kinase